MRRARQHSIAGQGRGRQVPSRWLFTDERLGGLHPADPLWRAIARLPRGSGIIFRHYGLPLEQRRQLLAAIALVARRRHLRLVGSRISGAPDGEHRPAFARSARAQHRKAMHLITASAHGKRDLAMALRAGADLVFLSPAFPTHSHPGAPALGPIRFGLMAQGAAGPVLALGGMTARRARRLQPLGAAGFAAIDFWTD